MHREGRFALWYLSVESQTGRIAAGASRAESKRARLAVVQVNEVSARWRGAGGDYSNSNYLAVAAWGCERPDSDIKEHDTIVIQDKIY